MPELLYTLIQLTWGLPQSLLGSTLFLKYYKAPHYKYKGAIVTIWPHRGGVSLGLFVFMGKSRNQDNLLRHEYGHTLQSLFLGPLYLLLVGLPSFIWANMPYYRHKRIREKLPYNTFFIEKSADHLGGNL